MDTKLFKLVLYYFYYGNVMLNSIFIGCYCSAVLMFGQALLSFKKNHASSCCLICTDNNDMTVLSCRKVVTSVVVTTPVGHIITV